MWDQSTSADGYEDECEESGLKVIYRTLNTEVMPSISFFLGNDLTESLIIVSSQNGWSFSPHSGYIQLQIC